MPACTLSAWADLCVGATGRRRPDFFIARPPTHPGLGIVIDFSVWRGNNPSRRKQPQLRVLHHEKYWAAIKASGGWGRYEELTGRGSRDLGAQVRFARCTPPHMRHGHANLAWLARLMGFPSNYNQQFSRTWKS